MGIEVGGIIAGKVTGITKYGAFVRIESGESGLVHISEIAHTYVNDVAEHLAVGQDVTVKVLGTENGRMKLSVKQAIPPPEEAPRRAAREEHDAAPSFEDKLRRFMKDADSRGAGARGYTDKKGRKRRS